jgi:hypothetical protein
VAKPVHTTDAAYIIGLNEAFARLAASGDNVQGCIAKIATAFCDPGLVDLHRAWDEISSIALLVEIQGGEGLDAARRIETDLRKELRARLIKHHKDYRTLMYGVVEGDVTLPN